jgi:hypothetical protein
MKRIHQFIHLTLVFLVPTVFVCLKIISKESDPLLSLTNKIFLVLTSVWTSYLVVELIKTGSNEEIKSGIIKKYRHLIITNDLFLWISNTILFVSLTLICYQILFFREVEFISDKKIELYESDSIGEITKVGDLHPDDISNYRIKVGVKYFLFKTPLGNEFTAIPPVSIPFVWQKSKIERIKLIANENFERLR